MLIRHITIVSNEQNSNYENIIKTLIEMFFTQILLLISSKLKKNIANRYLLFQNLKFCVNIKKKFHAVQSNLHNFTLLIKT